MESKKSLFYLAGILILIFFGYLIYLIRKPLLETLNPVLFALLLTYLLNPLVNNFQRKNLSRMASILFVYFLLIIMLCVIIVFLIPQLLGSIKDLMQIIPFYFEKYQILIYELIIRYRHSDLPAAIKGVLDQNIFNIEQILIKTLQQSVQSLTSVFSFLFDVILGAVIAFYMLCDIEKFRELCISFIPRKWREWVFSLAHDIDHVLSGFIRGQLVVAVILSILSTIGLWIIGVKYVLILGIIAGFSNIIPFFGPIIGAIPATIIALISNPISALWVVLLFFGLQQLESAVFSPKIVGCYVGLHPIATIIGVIIGGKLFGLTGLIFSVPALGIIKVLGSRIVKSIV